MADQTMTHAQTDLDEAEPGERDRLIEALMAQPPKARPSVIVFGDDAVFGFTPAPPPVAND